MLKSSFSAYLSPLLALLLLLTSPFALAQQMGTGMLAYEEGQSPRLVTANLSAGSVTLLERDSGKRLKEVPLGGDLRQLARADDGTLLVTDYSGDRLLLLDDDLDLERRSPPAIDPTVSSSMPSGSGSGSRSSNPLACKPMTPRATSSWMQKPPRLPAGWH